jgi:DNA polymerase-3 subunit epsilon
VKIRNIKQLLSKRRRTEEPPAPDTVEASPQLSARERYRKEQRQRRLEEKERQAARYASPPKPEPLPVYVPTPPRVVNPLPDIPVESLEIDLPFRVCFIDTETTGTSTSDRIVSWAVLYAGGGQKPVLRQGLIAPEVPISGMAQSVHGISTSYARKHGVDPFVGIEEFCFALPHVGDKTPIAGQNVQFDLAFIEREAMQYGFRYPWIEGGVLDSMHLGRDLLEGERLTCSLDALYRRYGVELDHEWRHTAAGDALGVARVLEAMWKTPRLSGLGVDALRRHQQMRGIYLRVPK